jgi:2-isopropylmalate synthase
VARALSAEAGCPIDVCSYEMARTADGAWAAFVGCRAGNAPLRFGVGVHADAATAAVDALISAVNRFEWSDDERQAAA